MVILVLSLSPFPFQTSHGVMPPDPAELLSLLFLAGDFLFPLLPTYLLQGGSGSLFLFLPSCHLEPHVALGQLGGRDYSPGWPGGGLQVGDCRVLL